ncbi:MAG: hypothetical protein HC836_16630 [Richelia sp. RM2_1_2]|nr:hypothetical protein [Richelia sp. RM2_1_2]
MRLKELQQTDGSEFIKHCESLAEEIITEFNNKVLSGELSNNDWDNYYDKKLKELYDE